jgi:hypothetical protein
VLAAPQSALLEGASAPEDGAVARVALRVSALRLRTDRLEYAPGEAVIVTGSGWQPGEVVTFTLHEEPQIHPDRTWTGFVDFSGELFDNQLIAGAYDGKMVFFLTARGESSGLQILRTFGNPSVNIDQCANGGVGKTPELCSGSQWVNGNLGASKAHYAEGDSISYRDTFINLAIGAGFTYCKTIEWDTTKGGKHAIDYITTWDATNTGGDPCGDEMTCGPDSPDDTLALPNDPGPDGLLGTADDIYNQADEGFRKSGNEASLVEYLQALQRKHGTVKQSHETGWHVNTTPGGTMVTIGYDVEFSEGKGTEQFVFRISGDKALLYSYNVNSPLLITR